MLTRTHTFGLALIAFSSMQAMLALASNTVAQYGVVVLNQVGCNTTAIVQVTGVPDTFLGRQMLTDEGEIAGITGPNDCSGGDPSNKAEGKIYNRWALSLSTLNWSTHQFKLIKAVLDTSIDPNTHKSRAVITGGPMKGAVISSASDPDVVSFGGELLVVFECTLAIPGSEYAVQGTSSCIGVYDTVNEVVDLSRTQVIISGAQLTPTVFVAASVPQLMAYEHRLFICWSALTVNNSVFQSISIRAAELLVSNGKITVKGGGKTVVRSLDLPATVQIWAATPSNLTSNTSVDARAMWVAKDGIVAAAGIGGSGCTANWNIQAGCFRLALAGTHDPLGSDTFNLGNPIDAASLPSNPQEYTRPIRNPAGDYWFIGHYIRPIANGVSDVNPMPNAAFWRQYQGGSALIMFPMSDTSLWPQS